MTALYLEHYLDGLETLPVELQRNFMLMRDLDIKAQDLLAQIDDLSDEYMKASKSISPYEKTRRMNVILTNFTKCKEYGDDKVSLAMQTYDLVDKHIRKLDADLARFEAELKEKALSARQEHLVEAQGTTSHIFKKCAKKKSAKGDVKKIKGQKRKEPDDCDDTKIKRKNGISAASTVDAASLALDALLPMSVAASDVLDMPVDPNEPTYCICHQVSYGEMIGCDNNDCSTEWFHFGCVGLTAKPKGKWFCPRCLAERKKK